MPQDNNKIIIGIDFGTTYSGIGWLHPAVHKGADDGGAIIHFRKKGFSYEKAPTSRIFGNQRCSEILYDGASAEEYSWGWDAHGDPRAQKYFKLKLDPTQQDNLQKLLDIEYPANSQLRNRPFELVSRLFGRREVTAVHEDTSVQKGTDEICTDYLTAIGNEAIKNMTKKLGKEIVETTPKRYVLTVPAIWSDQAKNSTKQCAIKAFGSESEIEIIAEPQAAAIFALKQKLELKALVRERHYVVCDAGGGTVDLVTYQVQSTNPLELGVSGRGTGDVCGSLFLNRGFEEYLATKIGPLFRSPVNNAMDKAWDQIRNQFENQIKRNFESQDEEFNLRLPPGLPDIEGSEDGFLIVTGEEIARIFEPVVAQILKLIKDQIRIVKRKHNHAKIAGILLVGGLGESPYLMERVKKEFETRYEILQPPHGWSAVVRGALLWGADHSTVTKYVSSRSYGQELTVDWNNKPGRIRKPHPITGRPSCEEMKWLIKAGTEITREEPASSHLTMYCDLEIHDFLTLVLWAWDPQPELETEPDVRDERCYEVGKLKMPLDWLRRKSPAELSQFRENQNPYYTIKFKIELLFSTDISFSAEFNNGPKAAVTIKYDD